MVKNVCEINLVNEEAVSYVKSKMLSEDNSYSTVEYLNILNDLSRFKIIQALSIRELCVCDIACLFGMSQSATSHQLRVLRNAKIVKYRKEGKIVYYSLSNKHTKEIVNSILKHINH